MEYALEVKNLTKEYKDFAVKDISLKIPKGSVLGLIGENGAGKSTFINSILNIVKPNEGEISILGKDLYTYEKEIKEEIAVIFDRSHYNENLKPSFVGKMLSKIYKNWDNDKFYNLLKEFDIPVDKKIKQFSKGMKMKFEFACALSHSPKFLILDESTSGLDPVFRDEILEILRDFTMDEEHTILMSSHITSDLDKIADYIAFIHDGRMKFIKTYEDIHDNYGVIACKKEFLDNISKEDIVAYKKETFGYKVLIKNRLEIMKVFKDLQIENASIEDVMLFYIKGEKSA
ncbi:ABC transporter ATP-binding protein [Anaerofustis stercorihominis]|uniref:ABC transporter ATP-binding protein n=1 Tax=Anaerofustis stercorihominis TaxID=214853 RepID=A0A3E3E2W7_9FIRM|nr:ABC transporter ATP-binding protein [Anaerofustis stercorihominis]RGD75605.1 ABC transporter ATP-binding protein [Anaerofustis stercorihominis]